MNISRIKIVSCVSLISFSYVVFLLDIAFEENLLI